jgi:hypothetical protein
MPHPHDGMRYQHHVLFCASYYPLKTAGIRLAHSPSLDQRGCCQSILTGVLRVPQGMVAENTMADSTRLDARPASRSDIHVFREQK